MTRIRWWPRHASPRRAASPAADSYPDLRERLPAELRDQPDDQIPLLWLAWSEARSGYDAGHLIRTFQLAPGLAHRLVDLAHERHREDRLADGTVRPPRAEDPGGPERRRKPPTLGAANHG